jgi:hypothetical protein
MSDVDNYPSEEFLRDFREWQLAHNREADGFKRARILFTRRYEPDLERYIYRLNRFVCIIRVLHQQTPQLTQDRIALRGGGKMNYLPEEMLLALLYWYCKLTKEQMSSMPDPNWDEVLETYDRLWKENSK